MAMMMEKPTGSYLYYNHFPKRESILSRQITGESCTHVQIDWGVNYALGYYNSEESLLLGGSHNMPRH